MSKFAQGYALLVGVGADLPNTVTDANGLANLLKDLDRCAYPAEQVLTLTGSNAKRVDILNALDQLAVRTGPDTTVVFYFSGHGYEISTLTGKSYFLMPYGYSVNALPMTAISGSELMAKLKAIQAQKMLILLDCCHAGGMDQIKAPGAEFAKAPIPPEAQQLLAQGSGRVIIASSQADELSYAGNPYSQFTQALIEALAGAGASRQDGYVRAADLALYARETVPRFTNQRQHPILHFEQADNFVVAYYAAGEKEPKELPVAAQRRDEAPPATSLAPADQTTNTGSGAIARGAESAAAGERGVAIQGDVKNNPIVTGDENSVQQATGRNIAQASGGGSATVNDSSSRSVFDQRGQTVHGPQTNIRGGVHMSGGIFNTGILQTSAVQSQAEVIAELRKLIAAVTQAGQQGTLDEETTIDAEAALRKAVAQAGKPNPERQSILSHLTNAEATIAAVTQNVTAVTGLMTAITAAIELVSKWLP